MISGRNISGKSVVTGLLAMTAAAILLTAGLNNSALNSNSNQAVAH
jgi:plastocyanin